MTILHVTQVSLLGRDVDMEDVECILFAQVIGEIDKASGASFRHAIVDYQKIIVKYFCVVVICSRNR
jgi:hypothetical protein